MLLTDCIGRSGEQIVNASLMFPDQRILLMVQAPPGDREIAGFVQAHAGQIEQALLEHGAVLLRGFDVRSVEDFGRFIDATGLQRIDYIYRSTPRTAVGDKIFTATEYPPQQEIVLHNENSYQRDWPMKVAFCCLVSATTGGATPLGDMRQITAAIGPRLLERFAERGVRYVRHHRRHMDLSWQVVFQTEEPEKVAEFCSASGIEFEWLDPETLRTLQSAHGAAVHPISGERLYFNQAHLFHVTSIGAEGAKSLIQLFGADRLPRHATYGNGEEIAPEDLEHVRNAFRRHEVTFPWQPGDIVLLDNMQVAHGRRPFRGPRKILASLLDARSRYAAEPHAQEAPVGHGEERGL
ncbi:MAG: TauD/TfdA family dioxygenase [Acidobacteriia bacterium]|nr:TauD/TfdA family dioxygenase [Terriglobia bacterium]